MTIDAHVFPAESDSAREDPPSVSPKARTRSMSRLRTERGHLMTIDAHVFPAESDSAREDPPSVSPKARTRSIPPPYRERTPHDHRRPRVPSRVRLRTGRTTISLSKGSHAEYSASVQMRTPHDHRRPRVPSRVRLRTGRPTISLSKGSHAEYSASVQRGRLMTIDAHVFPAESDSPYGKNHHQSLGKGSHAEYSASVQRGRLMTIDAHVFPAESDSVREEPPSVSPKARTRSIPPPYREDTSSPSTPTCSQPSPTPHGKTRQHSLGRLARGVFRLRTERTPHDHRRSRVPSRVRLRTGRPTTTPSAGSHAEYSASVQRGRLPPTSVVGRNAHLQRKRLRTHRLPPLSQTRISP